MVSGCNRKNLIPEGGGGGVALEYNSLDVMTEGTFFQA